MNKTEAVMARYRELGSTLEASRQVRDEFEKKGGVHLHRLHERCWCGFLTVPARFYEYDGKGRQLNTQEQAEADYAAVLPLEQQPETVTTVTQNKRTLVISGQDKRMRGRPRKWASEAERKRAYRNR